MGKDLKTLSQSSFFLLTSNFQRPMLAEAQFFEIRISTDQRAAVKLVIGTFAGIAMCKCNKRKTLPVTHFLRRLCEHERGYFDPKSHVSNTLRIQAHINCRLCREEKPTRRSQHSPPPRLSARAPGRRSGHLRFRSPPRAGSSVRSLPSSAGPPQAR